ncbi:MAG: N-acetyltransferase [Faecalibacterium prausnitzii]
MLGATLPLDLALFSKSQPWRFYAGPTLALELSGSTAWAAGHANPEELASFLAFCGCESIILDDNECPPPAGWCKAETLTVFGLAPGKALLLPAADETLWAGLTLDREPSAMDVARALYPADTAKQEDFYSELCTKRTRGKALVWALRQGSETICTVGAYALANRQAYMACGQNPAFAGQGHRRAAHCADGERACRQGEHPVFLCSPERVHFYTRLGFEKLAEYIRYVPS